MNNNNNNNFSQQPNANEELSPLENLAKQARQAVQRCEQELRQITVRDQQCNENNKMYLSLKQKLQTIFADIQKQLGVIRQLVTKLRQKTTSLIDSEQKQKVEYEKTLSYLKDMLEKLKMIQIHQELIVSSEASIDKKTLYDYVNVESVTSLVSQAEAEINAMSKIDEDAKLILRQTDEQYTEVSNVNDKLQADLALLYKIENEAPVSSLKLSQNLGSSSASNLSNSSSSQKSVNDAEIKAMSNITLEITGLQDRIQHIISNPVYSSAVDIKEVEKKFSQLPEYTMQFDLLLKKVTGCCNYIDLRHTKIKDCNNSAVSCYKLLEKMSPAIPSKFVQIDTLTAAFQQKRASGTVLFEEIHDLSIWYALFQASYENLLLEIDRRHKALQQQVKMVEDFKQQMQAANEGMCSMLV